MENFNEILALSDKTRQKLVDVSDLSQRMLLFVDYQDQFVQQFSYNEEIIQKNINEIDSKITNINQEIFETEKILMNLQRNYCKNNHSDEKLLSNVLKSVAKSLNDMIFDALDHNTTRVPIFSLIQLEEDISKTIKNLSIEGIFVESAEASKTRIEEQQIHMKKVIEFLKSTLSPQEMAK